MDESRYRLREFRDSDCEAVATIYRAVQPDDPVSAASVRHLVETWLRPPECLKLVIEDRRADEVIASGNLFLVPYQEDPTRPWISVDVHPTHRRQGVGSHLYDAFLAEAGRRGAIGLRCTVAENQGAGQSFLANRGFEERRRSWRSSLDVATASTAALGPLVTSVTARGIELTTLSREGADDPDVLRRVYALDAETGKDVPHVGPYTPPSFEDYKRYFLGGEGVLTDAWFLAKDGDRYVGISFGAVEPGVPRVLQQFYTATRREYRRRNIALTLKLQLIDFVKRNGFARIETSNDSMNVPMWTLNQRLGFRKIRENIHLESVFAGSGTSLAPKRPLDTVV
jgi:mycothiol synthase